MAITDYVIMPGADYKAICDAVRAKTGKTETIKSGEVASEISDISTGVDTSEDTVTSESMLEGVTAHDAFGEQIVGSIQTWDGEVNEEIAPFRLQEKVVNENGEVLPDVGYDGFSRVDVEVDLTESYNEGYASGHEDGFDEGKEEGIQTEYDRFWDAYQEKGKLGVYEQLFSNIKWNDETFKPKYDIIMTGWSNQAFARNRITDLIAALDRCGVILDTSGATDVGSLFAAASTTRVPEISAVSASNLYGICNVASKLVELQKLVIKDDGSQTFQNSFNNCTSLTTITFEGVIGQDINFQWSPLSAASIESVITHLSDTATGKTATFSVSAVNTAFETAEGFADGSSSQVWLDLVATKPNWTISLV